MYQNQNRKNDGAYMIKKIINLFPRDFLVACYKYVPFTRFKNWFVYRAQEKFLVAVLGVITNESNQVLLLKHVYRNEPWGIPGGWMELESPEEGLIREIFEETGLSVELTGVSRAIYNKNPNRVDLVFRGRVIGGTFKSCTEVSEICYCDTDQWPEGLPEVQKKLINEILISD
ncbi:NUDIX hydrolase [Paenibacillus sp. FSL R7-0652]|uniref:NUDIX hydrolase n=1 Tax=Paenibacillus sp. FSL R7-0652 TaxID=2921687 RepID=UPI00315B17AB